MYKIDFEGKLLVCIFWRDVRGIHEQNKELVPSSVTSRPTYFDAGRVITRTYLRSIFSLIKPPLVNLKISLSVATSGLCKPDATGSMELITAENGVFSNLVFEKESVNHFINRCFKKSLKCLCFLTDVKKLFQLSDK